MPTIKLESPPTPPTEFVFVEYACSIMHTVVQIFIVLVRLYALDDAGCSPQITLFGLRLHIFAA